ncbi:F-box only protein 8 [Ziziphus jujuba]|uniref:F-box only protein 8 n=1 Tax=Ziziphus jujuba TaxID=326968 RepID=A0A6P6G6F4_ZIZJJ|nr:F-box only protein 8 [Ziziphus jujuba]XP_024929682.3 F-box only protein 8 [Ziziphus jujuba]XP_024929683.3 F-box only protein 8 [Ziziphus jujuba]XP_024929686.3 F-box only protein 8 [Ziziphus jujuba]XP_024929692.3 F-box only protein 8 [Ziziphus jujuba]
MDKAIDMPIQRRKCKHIRRTKSKHTRRSKGNWNEVQFTIDIVTNILSRIPVQGLLLFKTVSKLWNGLISSSNFKKLQLTWSRDNPMYILYPYTDAKPKMYVLDEYGDVDEMITLPGCENVSDLSMICSYDGLVCFINYLPVSNKSEKNLTELEIRMCNPATREVLLLPKSSPSVKQLAVGVAFGPETGCYKVFRFFLSKSESEPESDSEAEAESPNICIESECDIYSSATGTWRGIGRVPHRPMGSNHVYVDGKVYWFVASKNNRDVAGSILSVDMEENFSTMSLPDFVTEHSFLVDFDGCLSLVVVYDEDLIINIWDLTDSNESEWDLKCSDAIPYTGIECTDSLTVIRGEVFLITTNYFFIFYPKENIWRKLALGDELEVEFPVVFKYSQSFLPCNGASFSDGEEDKTTEA